MFRFPVDCTFCANAYVGIILSETDTTCFKHNSVALLSKSIFISILLLSFTMLHELFMENGIILLYKIMRLVLIFFFTTSLNFLFVFFIVRFALPYYPNYKWYFILPFEIKIIGINMSIEQGDPLVLNCDQASRKLRTF